jgi:hypothetical protein
LIGLGAKSDLRYSQFLKLIHNGSRGEIPDTVTGSIWDRAADGEMARVKDLADSMYEMANDSRQIKNMFANLV